MTLIQTKIPKYIRSALIKRWLQYADTNLLTNYLPLTATRMFHIYSHRYRCSFRSPPRSLWNSPHSIFNENDPLNAAYFANTTTLWIGVCLRSSAQFIVKHHLVLSRSLSVPKSLCLLIQLFAVRFANTAHFNKFIVHAIKAQILHCWLTM